MLTFLIGVVSTGLVIWFIVLIIGSTIRRSRSPKKETSRRETESKAPEPAPSQNATQPVPEPVKPVEKSSGPGRRSAWFDLAVWIIALIAIFFFVRWAIPEVNEAVPAPGPSWEERQSAAMRTQSPQPARRHQSTLRLDSTWSEWVLVPDGYRLWVCDRVQDPECSAPDFGRARFQIEYQTRDGSTHELTSGHSKRGTAARFRGTSGTPFTLDYELIPR